jgi:diguanylate cyclase (GGDEF)-like protein
VDIAEIAHVISKDPALSGKILRTVNSSFYGRSQNVGTISHALVILGLKSVKTLVLGFTLLTALSKNKSKGFRHLDYWKRSIYSATAASTVARRINREQQEEAFLAALLADLGMLVLDTVVGAPYGAICASVASHAQLPGAEKSKLGMTHAEVGGILAQHWNLPPVLHVPIAHHHDPQAVSDSSLRRLAEIVQISGHCADVFVDAQPATAITEVRRLCREHCRLGAPACDALMNEVGKSTREVASLFEINIGSSETYEAILKQANAALVEITLQTQRENQELAQAATTDGLTALSNRPRLDAFLSSAFESATKTRKPLSVVMIDVDYFKKINDTYGHLAGDAVLRAIAKVVKGSLRPTDLAARYGGEEIVLCLPETSRTTAEQIAETIRRNLAAKPVESEGSSIPVTASFGVATYEPSHSFPHPVKLLKAADSAMYAAKHDGRNCVKTFSPAPRQKPAAA